MSHSHHDHLHDHSHAHSHHSHDHSHLHTSNKVVLRVSFIVIAAYMLVEIIGGLLTDSLALLSDAGHMFSDAAAIGLSLYAFKLGEKAVNARNTFGYKRFEILAAALNGLALIVIAAFILLEAVERFKSPLAVASQGMLAISVLGLLVNVFVAWYMHRNADVQENLNMKSAYLHVLGDLFGSIGAIVAALLILFFGWNWADPLVSILVALLIANSGFGVLKSTFHVLMEGAPEHIDHQKLLAMMLDVKGVQNVHDLHLWTITSNQNLLSAHLVVDGQLTISEGQQIIQQIEQKLKACHIQHITLQLESPEHQHSDSLYCAEAHEHEHEHEHEQKA